MLRLEQPSGWSLVEHRDHAQLAGELAEAWGNARVVFAPFHPETLVAIRRHDDAWTTPDASPALNAANRPAAFSRDLVGRYSAFEDVELTAYLTVRAAATDSLANDYPYAALLVSMHTTSLLSDSLDASSLSAADRATIALFLGRQRARQGELSEAFLKRDGDPRWLAEAELQRAFRFLQLCDHLSLLLCVDALGATTLRHRHPLVNGARVEFRYERLQTGRYRVAPYPFLGDAHDFSVPVRTISLGACDDPDNFRRAVAACPKQPQVAIVVA